MISIYQHPYKTLTEVKKILAKFNNATLFKEALIYLRSVVKTIKKLASGIIIIAIKDNFQF